MLGKKSGINFNKIKESGFTPVFDQDTPYFKESRLVIICKKIYCQYIDPSCFIDNKIDSLYYKNDHHKMFVGEIVKVLSSNEE